ncbi:MAG: hypothetical protein ACRD2G_17840, partial [Terriglobia bacterium]
CQDNEISWLDWNLDDRKKALLNFTRFLIELRRGHPNFHRRKFCQDRKISPASVERMKVDGLEVHDLAWYRPDGELMTEEEWNAGWVRCLGMRLSGRTLNDVDRHGEVVCDDSFLFCLNPHHEHIEFYLPRCATDCAWETVFDTRGSGETERRPVKPGETYDMLEHSAVLFCEVAVKTEEEEQPKERTRKKRQPA